MRTPLGIALLASFGAAVPFVLEGCGSDGDPGAGFGSDAGALDGTVVTMIDAATSGKDAGPIGDAMTAAQACTDLAHDRCAALDQCSDSVTTLARWGGVSECQTRLAAQCLSNLEATGTGATPATTEACALLLKAAGQGCSDILANTLPEECTPATGTLPNFSPCFVAGQCQSSYCALPASSACGTCAPVPQLGDPCAVAADCGNRNGLSCAGQVCVQVLEAGAPCQAGVTACATGYACIKNPDAGASVDAGANCRREGVLSGDACDSANSGKPTCDTSYGLACVMSACVAVSYAVSGAACGSQLDGGEVRCAASGTCMDAGLPNGKNGTCVSAAADDAACDTALGPACLPQARCVISGDSGSTSGTCLLLDNATCHQ